MAKAEIIADSICRKGRLTTFLVTFPRIILPQVLTHRVFERCGASSRAIPTAKQIENLKDNPFVPERWGANQKGMQAYETLDAESASKCETVWKMLMESMCEGAEELARLGAHKQLASRPLETFGHMTMVISTTELDNFFTLRISDDAQDEIAILAKLMRTELENSVPVYRDIALDDKNSWHLPFVHDEERVAYDLNDLLAMSSARCARTSYLNHNSTKPTLEDDKRLYKMLTSSKHYSAISHCAKPISYTDNYTHKSKNGDKWSGCFRHWFQLRQYWELIHEEHKK